MNGQRHFLQTDLSNFQPSHFLKTDLALVRLLVKLTGLAFMLLLPNSYLFSQAEGKALVDSLYAVSVKMNDGIGKARILAAISYEMRHIDPNRGLNPGIQALLLALKYKDSYGEGQARYALALNYNYLSMLSESIDQSLKAAAIFEKLKDYDLLSATWFGLAQTYMSFDTAASRVTMLQAKALLPRQREMKWIIRNYGNLGNSYRNLDQFDSAMKYIQLHLRLAEQHHMKWQVMMAKNRIGSILFFNGSVDSAFPLLKEALDYFRAIGATQMVAQNSLTLGRLMVIKASEKGKSRNVNIDAAIAYGKDALEAARGIGFMMQMYGAARLLADIYAMQNDKTTAYKYLLMAETYKEKLYGANVVTKASMLNIKNEQRLKNQQLELLRLKNRQQMVTISLVLAGAGIMIIVVVFIISSRKKIRKAYTIVNRHKEEISRALGELETTNRQLESTNQELEAFSYSVSHDLRAPVRRIEGLCGILAEDHATSLDDSGKEVLRSIADSSSLMNILIEDMLKLSKVTRQTVSRTPCNLSQMALDVCESVRLTGLHNKTTFHVEDGIMVDADPHLLRIALQNLLDNAFKYSSKVSNPEVTVGRLFRDSKQTIFVRDNGVGFESEKAGQLFTPFHRLHSEEEFKGTGIGLATVKRIIMKHGGSIDVVSEVNKGTTFFFSMES